MKKLYFTFLASVVLLSCAPVLKHDLIQKGIFNFSMSELKENPDLNNGRLFILGGIIANTKVIKNGSLIEALYVPVDSRGYFRSSRAAGGRFLALYKGKDILDPMIFREKREITLAAEFIGTRKGNIGEMDYIYPLFEIKEIYLWGETETYYYIGPPYPPWYYPYWRHNPWRRYYYHY